MPAARACRTRSHLAAPRGRRAHAVRGGAPLHRARGRRPAGLPVTNENAPAVAEICARLDGLPLAIELAAARVAPALAAGDPHPAGAAARRSLRSGSRDLPERQQTLRGAIAWSHDLLCEPGSGGCSRGCRSSSAGARSTTARGDLRPGGDLGRPGGASDGLEALVDQSLVRRRTHRRAAVPNARDDPRVRPRAARRQPRRRAESRARHAERYLAPRREAAPHLLRGSDRAWLGPARARARQPPVGHRVVDRASRRGGHGLPPARPALWRFWQSRDHLAEAYRRLDAIAREPWSRADPVRRARLMEAVGGVAWWRADLPTMVSAYDEALEIWQSIGDKREIANALYNDSFKYAVTLNAASSDPDGIGLHHMQTALELFRRGRRRPRRGQRSVGNWQLPLLPQRRGRGHSGNPRSDRYLPAGRRSDDGGLGPAHAGNGPDPARRPRRGPGCHQDGSPPVSRGR